MGGAARILRAGPVRQAIRGPGFDSEVLADNEGGSFGFGFFLMAGQVVAAFVQQHVRGFVPEGRGANGGTQYDIAGGGYTGCFVHTILSAVGVAVGPCLISQGSPLPVVAFLGALAVAAV